MKRVYPDSPIVSIGAVILKGDMVLIIKRGVEPSKGKWSIPGGAIELGENTVDAVKREVLEETGLRIEVKGMIGHYDDVVHDDRGRIRFHYVILYFLADYVAGKARASSDIVEARWVTFDELKNYDMSQGTLDMLKKVKMEKYR